VAVSLYFALRSLTLGAGVTKAINSIITITGFVQLGFWAAAAVHAWIERRRTSAEDRAVVGSLSIISFITGVVIWTLVLLAALDNLGVNITALVAGLGIGGVAVALALQNVLTDLFSSVAIGLDKPFEVGEFIAFGDELGTVTKVGIKSTRIASLSGEELAISNSVLLKNLIHNYSRRQERRVLFTFRLPFDTPRKRIPEAVARVRGIIEGEAQTRFDRGALSGFGDYGLDFEFVYFVLDPSYNLYAEIQQRIYLKMLDLWDELDIEFAIPARKLHGSDGGIANAQAATAKQ